MKRLFAAILTGLSLSSPAPASGNPVINNHIQLVNAVKSTGTTYLVNPNECDDTIGYGWYVAKSAVYRELVICQENKVEGSTAMVEWTREDLDTLRHEAHHLVQDCMDNSLNSKLNNVYKTPVRLALDVMGDDKVSRIVKVYEDLSDHMIVMELEAFAVAAMNNPLEQVDDIKNYCF